jgi:short-subunit dehydrogenase
MNKAAFKARYGPWAIIAGASEGLGAAYARECARRGLNVVVVARSRDKLETVRDDIVRRHGVECRAVVLDLAHPDAATVLDKSTSAVDAGLLVYNAALSLIGPYASFSETQHRDTVAINCRTPALCAYLFGKRFTARGRGGILLMSSLAGLRGSPGIAHYAATKAYLLTLAQGLGREYASANVDVSACCAGAIATPGYAAASGASKASFFVMRPEKVAQLALDRVHKRGVYVPGALNALGAFMLTRILPRAAAVSILSQSTRKLLAASDVGPVPR